MGAADADGLLVALHQLAQEVRALHGRDAQAGALHALGVVLGDGGGVDHQIRAVDVLGLLAHHALNALLPQRSQQVAVGAVGAGDGVALFQQHFGKARHAGAADADHVDALAFIIADMRYVHHEHSLC